jgi:hypothetical protein
MQVMDAAIEELQQDFLTPEQIESSRAIMGIDTQLVVDGTYFIVFDDDRLPAAEVGAGEPHSTAATTRPVANRPSLTRPWTRPG